MKRKNPYAEALNKWLECKHKIKFKKKPKGGFTRNVGRRIIKRVWGLTHTLSEIEETGLKEWHKDRVRKEMNYIFEVAETYNGRLTNEGAWNVDRFVMRNVLDALYRLNQKEILNKKINEWLERSKLPVEWQYKNYWFGPGQKNLPGFNKNAGMYGNSDAMFIQIMGISGKLLNESKYLKRAHEFVELMEDQLLPAGGFNYIFSTNEINLYHGLNIECLARY